HLHQHNQHRQQYPVQQPLQEPSQEAWSLKEGEMRPDEIRSIGHILYVGMFAKGPSKPVEDALYEQAKQDYAAGSLSDNPEDENLEDEFDIMAMPVERYIEKFAHIYCLNPGVLKRFYQAASYESSRA